MINLLFISSNPKIHSIKNALQPLLKVKIDLVGDFDFGLKEVFEKRPALVFMQDQISGVTGESVARHIQMLLGSSAPSFIYLHDGNTRARPVKGLYDYLIDLSQDAAKVVEDIQSTLEQLLGSQWHKIRVPVKPDSSVVKAALAVPDEHRAVADQLVDDFISGLDDASAVTASRSPATVVDVPEPAAEPPFEFVSSPHDQIDEILAAAAKEIRGTAPAPAAKAVPGSEETCVSPDLSTFSARLPPKTGSQPAQAPAVQVKPAPAVDRPPASRIAAATAAGATPSQPQPGVSKRSPSLPVSPADFMAVKEGSAADGAASDVFREFEAEYSSRQKVSNRLMVIAALLVLFVAVGYFFLAKGGGLSPPGFPAKPSSTAAVRPVPDKAVDLQGAVQRSLTSSQGGAARAALPSFIPLAGHDSTFASQKPGWERYVAIDAEYRVFRSGGRLKAVQVLATKGHVLSESRLTTVLNELTGTGEYRVTSNEEKLGFRVSHAVIDRKADVLIYRKRAAVHAFVVALD